MLAGPAAATIVSAPFTKGFIGTQGSNTQQANNIKLFTTLGVARAYLQQNTDNGRFGGTQGNDYAATLKLVLNSGATISIAGNITWRDGANPLHGVGFIPLGTETTKTISYGSSQTYTLNTTSNYLVQLNTSSRVYTDGSNVGGNAANSGIFTELNTYLDTTLSSRPTGPVTVTAQDTYDTTPTVTGTATLGGTDDLTVEINGVVYTSSTGLTIDRVAGTWSVTIPNGSALPVATYPVTATIINQSGYILTDSTTNELRILTPVAAMKLVKTASVSGNTVTYTYVLTNTGALDIHSVSISESAGSFTGTGTRPTPAIDNAATGTADDDGILAVGEVWTYAAAYTVTQADRDSGSLTNSATASGLNPSNAAVSDVSDSGNESVDANSDGNATNDPTVTALTRSPALKLVKTSSVSGSTVTYSYVVTNTGNVTLTTVTLGETALGFTGTGTRPTPAINNAATGTADDDNELDVGESWTYAATYTLTQADIDAGSVSNSATASARDPSNTAVSDVSDNGDEAVDANSDGQAGNDPTVTTITRSPALKLVKTSAVSGRTVTYTYAATNTGNVTLHSVSLGETAGDFTGNGTLPSPAIDAAATGTADDDNLLNVGETWTWTATYTLVDADYLAGSVSNSATVQAHDPSNASVSDMSDNGDEAVDADSDGNPGNDATETSAVMAPALTLVKTASLTPTGLTYRYAVTNTGNVGLHNVAISESVVDFSGTGTLPSPQIDAAATGTADDDGLLDVGETWVFEADYATTATDRTAGAVTNSATASALDLANAPVSDVSDNGDPLDGDANPTVTALTGNPELTLVKTATVSAGVIHYRYDVSNSGNVPLNTVAVAETSADFTGTGSLPTASLDAALTGTADDDNALDPGETYVFTADYTLTQADIDAGSVSNSATATAQDANATPVSDVSDSGDEAVDDDSDGQAGNDPTVTTITANPALRLTKTAAASGNNLVYTYVVTNTGNVTLTGISITETAGSFTGTGTLPAPVIDGTATGSADDDNELDVGESWTYTATYTPTTADRDSGAVSNSATADATAPSGASVSDVSDNGNEAADDDADGLPGNDPTETPVARNPGMKLVKTSSVSGSTVSYTYVLTNTGDVTLTSVSVDESALGFSGTGTRPTAAIDNAATGTADDDNELDVGESWTYAASYTLTQADIDAGGVSNSATATANDPFGGNVSDVSDNGNEAVDDDSDGSPGNDPTVTTISRNPALKLVKTSTVSGNTITYTYVLSNIGDVTLTSVSVDESAAGFSGTGMHPLPIIDASATGTADDDNELDVGEIWTYTADYTLTQPDIDAGSVSNSATATANDPSNASVSDVSDNGDEAVDDDSDGQAGNDPTLTTITASPALQLTKTAAASGDDLVYTYVVTNTGNVTLTGVSITETSASFTGTGTLPSPVIDATATGSADDDNELDVGESWTYTATYSPTTADRDGGSISNSATADATAPSGASVSDVSDNGNEVADDDSDGSPGNDPTEATVPTTGDLKITHAITDLTRRFNTEYAATFRITLTNSGNITLHGVGLTNDLAAYVGLSNLIGTTSATKASGPAGVTVNGSFDGSVTTNLLSGVTLAPGEVVEIDVTFNFLTTSGFPAGNNSASATATELASAVSAEDDLGVTDDDNDGAVDSTESSSADRDGDGIADADDYDPTGYFYCEADGRILSGGAISISKQGGGSNSSVGTANNITIAQDGSGGYYQWWVDAPGTYTMAITYPAGTTASTTRLVNGATLDVTSLLPNDPAFIGSTEIGSTGYLADESLAANPTFYTSFDIAAGDPNVMANNIPVSNCALAGGASLVINDRDLTTGEETDDTARMTFALATAPSAPVTLTFAGDAQCRVEPATMTFTAADWAAPQRLTIIGRKDNVREGVHSCTPTVVTSSTDPAYDGLAPALSQVAVAEDLIALVEEQVREKLEADLAQTLAERGAEFRGISARAAMRLAEPVPEFCDNDPRLDPNGSIVGENGSLRIDGTLNSDGNACMREGRRIVQSRFALVRNADGTQSADISGDILRETRQSDNRLSGRFFGGYLRLPADRQGADTIRAIGLHAGLYGAEMRKNGWASDHYIALGIGQHDYDFTFGSALPIRATGNYRYAALYGGIALSRSITGETFVLTPRVGIDLALGIPASAQITARQGNQRQDGTITLDPLATARLYLEMGISLPDDDPQPGEADTDWSVTPSLFCDVATAAQSGCGIGLALDLSRVSADRNLTWGIEGKIEHSANADTLALTLRRIRQLEGVDGQVTTSVGIGSDGAPNASQTLNLRF